MRFLYPGTSAIAILFLATQATGALAAEKLGSVEVGQNITKPVEVLIPRSATIKSISVLTQGVEDVDFVDAGGGTCKVGVAYTSNSSCTIHVRFRPRFPGTRNGAAVLSDANGPIATTYLRGTGIAPQIGFLPGVQLNINVGTGSPAGVALDGDGNLFVAEVDSSGGMLGTGHVFKATRTSNFNDIVTIGSGFAWPDGVTVDGGGTIYVSDAGDIYTPSAIYKETPNNGEYVQERIAEGFLSVSGIAVDEDGSIYVSDYGNETTRGAVYKEMPSGEHYIETRIGGGFKNPVGIAVDANGIVYVADYGNSTVYKETPRGGGYHQSTVGSGWFSLGGIAVDATGSIYVSDNGYNEYTHIGIFKEAFSNGAYTQTLLSLYYPDASPPIPCGVAGMAIDGNGNIFAAACGPMELDFSKPQSFDFDVAYEGGTSKDSPKTVSPFKSGNAPLKLASVAYSPNFPENTEASGKCAPGISLDEAQICKIAVNFTPTTVVPRGTEGGNATRRGSSSIRHAQRFRHNE